MGFVKHILIAVFLAVGGFLVYSHFKPQQKVTVLESKWYGSGSTRVDDTAIKPFTVHVTDIEIKELKARLSSARVGHEVLEDSNDFTYGFNSKMLEKVRTYWMNTYDWRKTERQINAFPQFTTEIEGMQVHFIRSPAASGYTTVKPMLMVHGWPGNVYEFVKIIPLLNDPRKHGIESDIAFEIIAPSIPGYGFSSAPKKSGFSQIECARVFRKLMNRLGYKKYLLQGGDWGSVVTANMAKLYPEQVIGLHLNMLMVFPSTAHSIFLHVVGQFFPKLVFSNAPTFNLLHLYWELTKESGYMHIQGTKPDTIGTPLNDSPIGLAAYILEKFSTWTNAEYRNMRDGGLTKKFTMDELLSVVSIYWFQQNIVPSQRFYREFFSDVRNAQLGSQYVSVPTAHSAFGNEMFDKTPLELALTGYNVTSRRDIPNGGHFAALEEPRPLAEHVIHFASSLI